MVWRWGILCYPVRIMAKALGNLKDGREKEGCKIKDRECPLES